MEPINRLNTYYVNRRPRIGKPPLGHYRKSYTEYRFLIALNIKGVPATPGLFTMSIASSSKTVLQAVPKSSRFFSTCSRTSIPRCRYCLTAQAVSVRAHRQRHTAPDGLSPTGIWNAKRKQLNTPPPSHQLPTAYTYYPKHNDVPLPPLPDMAKVYESDIYPPHVPRGSVFHYLWPPQEKGEVDWSFPVPPPQSIAFIDGLTGRRLYREEIPTRAMWLASGMRKTGFMKGDTACIFGQNSLEWVEANFAIQSLTSVTSPANYA